MSGSKEKDFKELLNNQYNWPADYLFKFIVNKDHKEELLGLFEGHKVIEKPSSKGKYISISGRILMHNAEEVMGIYSKASKIKTVISL
jgi:uncharacterized protein